MAVNKRRCATKLIDLSSSLLSPIHTSRIPLLFIAPLFQLISFDVLIQWKFYPVIRHRHSLSEYSSSSSTFSNPPPPLSLKLSALPTPRCVFFTNFPCFVCFFPLGLTDISPLILMSAQASLNCFFLFVCLPFSSGSRKRKVCLVTPYVSGFVVAKWNSEIERNRNVCNGGLAYSFLWIPNYFFVYLPRCL